MCSKFIDSLRRYPIFLPVAPNIKLHANLANSAFFPLLKYGLYPHQATEDFIISTFLKDGDCVIDIGANIGYVSLLCSQYVGDGVVYSFEPSAISFNFVNQMASQVKQIKPLNLAVSNTSGMVRFIDEAMSDCSHIAESQDRFGYLVESCTIDDWAIKNKKDRVDFIKVDTEGNEIKAIMGAQKMIKSNQPVIEFEAFTIDDVSQIYDSLHKLDSTAEYKIYRCNNKYPLSILAKSAVTNNWFAIPSIRLSDVPDFIFRRGFLVEAYLGTDS
jgi:FkbM family methyltransferase